MQAIIKTGGKQYVVAQGQKLKVEKLDATEGSEVNFDVLVLTGSEVKVGNPVVAGAKVVARILRNAKSRKVLVSTYKRRKGYHKTRGHRQQFTEIQIQSINA